MRKRIIAQEKTALLIMIFFMITLMWACVKAPVTRDIVWSKPQATPEEFTKDKQDCIKKAEQPTLMSKRTDTERDVVDIVDIYNACMEARGWKLKEISIAFADGTTYKGDVVHDTMNGRGIYTWANGEKYEGDWKEGKANGRGIYTWANGHKYEGDWMDGKLSGKGTYTCSNGKKFTGNFENNQPIGFNINCAVTDSGVVSVPQKAADGYPQKVSHTFANGNKYEGSVLNGKLHGRGTLTSPSGIKYEGDFVDGRINGSGTYTCSNGKTFTGDFENNEPVGFTINCY